MSEFWVLLQDLWPLIEELAGVALLFVAAVLAFLGVVAAAAVGFVGWLTDWFTWHGDG